MFIVVVTLGLLAAMGVYGLSATQSDIKSAGHGREALQSQRAGEHALMMTAETLNPKAAQAVIQSMSGSKRTTNCTTAVPYVGPDPAPPGAACRRINEAEMKIIGLSVNTSAWSTTPGFGADSFGAVNSTPTAEVEISNPVDIPPAAGSGYDPATQRFTQITVTVLATIRSSLAPNTPAQSAVMGRGRMTVGPITGAAAAY